MNHIPLKTISFISQRIEGIYNPSVLCNGQGVLKWSRAGHKWQPTSQVYSVLDDLLICATDFPTAQ